MRKLAAAFLAVPVLLPIYVPIVLRRSIALRVALSLGVGGLLGLGALGILTPHQTIAVPASTPAPVASTAFGPVVQAGLAPNAAVDITFSRAMDRAAVAAAVTVTPSAPIALTWDATSERLAIKPAASWALGTLYTITVGASAADAGGQRLDAPLRAAFVTRAATRATIQPTDPVGTGVSAVTTFAVTFDHPVDIAAAQAAFLIRPSVVGKLAAASGADAATTFTFTPDAPLTAGVTYTVALAGTVTDTEGAAVDTSATLNVKAMRGPSVVRFRPRDGTTDVLRGAALSVRFTQPMDRTSTAAAWSATANGKPITGKIAWGEGDTVLVFTPSAVLPVGAKIVMTVAATAASHDGVALARPITASATVTKPAKVVKKSGGGGAVSTPIPHASGGSVGSGSWHAVETYYLKLMNCTRTGGWVTSSGSCSSPGGLSTAPIILDAGLSDKVSRPYAKLLATDGACDHFINGTPTDRLHRAGYSGWAAENIGCRAASSPFASVLGTHLFFQSEKPCSGYCHYNNLMNPAYKRCGIGVWVASGRVRLVIDFYHS